MEKKLHKKRSIVLTILLVLCNIALILTTVLFTIYYSQNIQNKQVATKLETFQNNVETLKQLSEQFLDYELDNAKKWANYIESKDMTLDEALAYVSQMIFEADELDYEAHFVDMETFDAYGTLIVNGSNELSCYKKEFNYVKNNPDEDHRSYNITVLRKILNGEKAVLSKYKPFETQKTVISLGSPVTLRTADSQTKQYVLLRVISIERMKKCWVFPTSFSSAEIGLVASNADYIVQSLAMRGNTFIDYIRYYNFENDFNAADTLLAQLKTQKSGLLTLNDYKKQPCYWYYSELETYPDIDILGYIPVSALQSDVEGLPIVRVVSLLLVLLMVIDGLYMLGINFKLKEAAVVAEQANKSKTQFLSTMSHDIRTPLNAVLGMTELAQNKIDDKEYVHNCLKKITVSGNHLLTLINDILEISRVESGQINVTLQPFDVKDMVLNLESITRSQAIGHGLNFEIKADELPHSLLLGDKLHLSQIYLNLLNNAVKYTKAGGSVYMKMSEENVTKDGKLLLVFTVRDTGVGMSEEFQSKMYESFSRVSDTRTDKIQGAGLGLYIVKRMVELMKGTIECESRLGEGTTFTVSVPLSVAEETEVQLDSDRPDEKNSDLKGTHILVAEDNEINWEIISTLFEGYGIVCKNVVNGRECVDELKAQIPGTYDLVLMDIQMPVMNGLDATRELRACDRSDLQQIPIVAMTADAFAEDKQNCLDAGMNAHIAKPIEIEKVLSTIRRLLFGKTTTITLKAKKQ